MLLFLLVWMQRDVPESVNDAMLPAVTVSPDPEAPSLPAPQVAEQDAGADGEDPAGGVFTMPEVPAVPLPRVVGSPTPTTVTPTAVPGDEPVAGDMAVASDRAAVPVHSPSPEYPRQSRRRGESGEVLVRAVVGPDGTPRQVEVARSSSHRALDQAAVRAVSRWRFEPATRQGRPVSQVVQVPVLFRP